MIILGIDQGNSGGYCYIEVSGPSSPEKRDGDLNHPNKTHIIDFCEYPMKKVLDKPRIDWKSLDSGIVEIVKTPDLIFAEFATALPTNRGKFSGTMVAARVLGRSEGGNDALWAVKGVDISYVQPQEWQKAFYIHNPTTQAYAKLPEELKVPGADTKEQAMVTLERIFGRKLTTKLGRYMTGPVDAALIALYGYAKATGDTSPINVPFKLPKAKK